MRTVIDSKAAWDRFRLRHPHRLFYRVPFLQPFWDRREIGALMRCLFSGTIANGPEVEVFEREVCAALGVRHAMATNFGRTALELAFRALELQPGDEVMLPSFICTGGVMVPILKLGLQPVFVDVEADLGMSLEALQRAISPKTKALVVCHLSGRPEPRFRACLEFAASRGIPLIEDAAQAFGARIGQRAAGTIGAFGILSFGCGKNLVSGGGMLISNEDHLARKARHVRLEPASVREALWEAATTLVVHRLRRFTLPFALGWGLLRRSLQRGGWPPFPALRRMANLQAAIGRIQLRKLEEIIRKQQANAQVLIEQLAGVRHVRFPQDPEGHLYTKCLLEVIPPDGRDEPLVYDLAAHLLREGIEIEWSYTPIPAKPSFSHYPFFDGGAGHRMARHLLVLPVHPCLDRAQMKRIAGAIINYFQQWN